MSKIHLLWTICYGSSVDLKKKSWKVHGLMYIILFFYKVKYIFQVSQTLYFILLSGIRNTLVHFLAVCVISLCGYHAGASSMQAQHDPSMLLRFGNQAPVRKDYCDVNPVVLSLRLVHVPSIWEKKIVLLSMKSVSSWHETYSSKRHVVCFNTTSNLVDTLAVLWKQFHWWLQELS